MAVNSSANSVILTLFAFSDNLSAENYKLSAESGLPGLPFLECMGVGADMPKNIFFSKFFPDTCISLYFWILRGVSFLELFDLGPPSFAKMHIYVYIADLHGEVVQNKLNGQTNMLTRRTSDFSVTYHLQIPLLLL